MPGRRTHADCEPDKVHPGPAGHPQLQTNPAQSLPSRRRGAAERLATVHTPEGMPLPPNAMAELQREIARLGFVVSQIREIEEARQKRLERQAETGPHAMVRLLARIVGVGVETADMLVHEVLSRPMRDRRAVARGACPRAGQGPDPGAGLTGAPMRAARNGANKGSPEPEMQGSAAV